MPLVNMVEWLVIGISGVTCGGKTTLAHNLLDHFIDQRNLRLWNTLYVISEVQLISQDDYFLPVDDSRHQRVEQLNAINFEVITALDMKKMLSDIMRIMKERCLIWDFHVPAKNKEIEEQSITHSDAENLKVHSKKLPVTTGIGQMQQKFINILIIEGFLIFSHPQLLMLCDIKFHLHLTYDQCWERRRKRTYDPPDVDGYFEKCVWPHYEKNYDAIQDNDDIIILHGEVDKQNILTYTLRRIAQYMEGRCSFNSIHFNTMS